MIAFFLAVRGKIRFDSETFYKKPSICQKVIAHVPEGTISYTIQDDVKIIGPGSFTGVAKTIKHVNFKKAVELERVGNSAFAGCIHLTQVNLSNCKKLWIIGSYAFALTTLRILELPPNLRVLDYAAFYGTGIYVIKLPETTQWILDKAFSSSYHVQSIIFSDVPQVKYIGSDVFGPLLLNKFEIPSSVVELSSNPISEENTPRISVSQGNLFYSSNKSIIYNKQKSILHKYYGTNFTNFSIPNCTHIIGKEAFQNSNVKFFNFSHIKTICSNAFESSKLQALVIPPEVELIGLNAFSNCVFKNCVIIEGHPKLIRSFNNCKFEKGIICDAAMIGVLIKAGVSIKSFMY